MGHECRTKGEPKAYIRRWTARATKPRHNIASTTGISSELAPKRNSAQASTTSGAGQRSARDRPLSERDANAKSAAAVTPYCKVTLRLASARRCPIDPNTAFAESIRTRIAYVTAKARSG